MFSPISCFLDLKQLHPVCHQTGCQCCSYVPIFCCWWDAILFSVSETGEGCGEGETETGRDCQLRGQGNTSSPLYTEGINHFFKIEILLAAEINGMTVWYINVPLKQLLLGCRKPASAVGLNIAEPIVRWNFRNVACHVKDESQHTWFVVFWSLM